MEYQNKHSMISFNDPTEQTVTPLPKWWSALDGFVTMKPAFKVACSHDWFTKDNPQGGWDLFCDKCGKSHHFA